MIKGLWAPDDCTVIVRYTKTFWPLYIFL